VADGHPFFTAAGLGFEAEVSARFNHFAHRGFLRYFVAGAPLFRASQFQEYRIGYGAHQERRNAFTLAVANSDQYGNHAFIAPGARVDDGLLNLTIVPPVTLLNALPLLWRLFAGTLGRSPGVILRQSAAFAVERAAPGLIHTDGETHLAGQRVEFTPRPRSLRVLAPPV
jgi:diacylglycerol kinase family enzyme